MKHIIDTNELEKILNKYEGTSGWASALCDDLRALLDRSPSVSDDGNSPPDIYDVAVDTGEGIYHTAEVVHFQQTGSKRMIQVRIGEPQADDVRKDAERFVAWFSDNKICDAIPHDFKMLGEEPTLDQWREAIDKARE